MEITWPLEGVERGKQGRRTIPLVVMGHGSAAPLLDRQAGLGPVQGLNLALLVGAQNDSVLGWIQLLVPIRLVQCPTGEQAKVPESP